MNAASVKSCRALAQSYMGCMASCSLIFAVCGHLGAAEFSVEPPAVSLAGKFERVQLVVRGQPTAGEQSSRAPDLTGQVQYRSSRADLVDVDATGVVTPHGNGEASISITHGDQTLSLPVVIRGVSTAPTLDFARDVLPILSKAGCNAGACHASQYGKGGFKLSVFGFAPEEDFAAIVRDRQGRRVDSLQPERSLFLLKPTLRVTHGGNRRFRPTDVAYQVLSTWLAAPATGGTIVGPSPESVPVVGIRVSPQARSGTPGFTQQLRVAAEYANGTIRDVTQWARYDSLDDSVATVSPSGLVTTQGRGQVPIMVRFEGQAQVAMFTVPYSDAPLDPALLAGWSTDHVVDRHAVDRFRELALAPSKICDDATFLRRAYLDAIGTLPSPADTIAFLDDVDTHKRDKLVARLLGLTSDPGQDAYRDEYAAYWSIKWADLIRSSASSIGEQGMWALHNWLLNSLRDNKPFDQFVRELITARGSAYSHGPANYYRVANNPNDLAETTAQLFLGVRLQCAKCHHHPYEKFSQDDYYGFAAFFARVGTKGSHEFGIFGQESVVLVRSGGEVAHPKTGKVMTPTPLDGEPVAQAFDRRQPLADWLTAKDNKFFARNVVNRYVSYLFGRGLVEPVDDLRATNPASNEELLDALAADFVAGGFDLKRLLYSLMTSRLYQLDSHPTSDNAVDERLYSHFQVKRMAAEPLLDAIDLATGVPTKFRNLPLGTRAIELPDAEYPDYFLKTFGKPRRASVCECERTSTANLAQSLHTLNGEIIANKINHAEGRVAKLAATGKPLEDGVTELYLATLCRRPTAAELDACRKFQVESPDLKTFYEDLMWSLLNSTQFLYIH